MKVLCLLTGGKMHKISVGGRIIEFEMHRYCGPNILNRKGEPLKNQPADFLHAASLWAQQGQKVDENGLCIYYHEPEPTVEVTMRSGAKQSVDRRVSNHPAKLAKYYAAIILRENIDLWEIPSKEQYSVLKQGRIKEHIRKLAAKLVKDSC